VAPAKRGRLGWGLKTAAVALLVVLGVKAVEKRTGK
jgi:hypothetical protein